MLLSDNGHNIAAQILGIKINALESEIRYAYYRLMTVYHPDISPDKSRAHQLSALINEAKDMLLGKEKSPTLLKDKELVTELVNQPISDENIMSYEQWLKKHFFNFDDCSIWPY